MKRDIDIYFFFENKKSYKVVKMEIKFFFYFIGKVKSPVVRLHILNHCPKFQRKIFIIVDEKWVKRIW